MPHIKSKYTIVHKFMFPIIFSMTTIESVLYV